LDSPRFRIDRKRAGDAYNQRIQRGEGGNLGATCSFTTRVTNAFEPTQIGWNYTYDAQPTPPPFPAGPNPPKAKDVGPIATTPDLQAILRYAEAVRRSNAPAPGGSSVLLDYTKEKAPWRGPQKVQEGGSGGGADE
jgi:hypothetical protein